MLVVRFATRTQSKKGILLASVKGVFVLAKKSGRACNYVLFVTQITAIDHGKHFCLKVSGKFCNELVVNAFFSVKPRVQPAAKKAVQITFCLLGFLGKNLI